MLSAIKQFFDRQIRPEAAKADGEHAMRLATAALLIEVMRADYQVSEAERRAVLKALEDEFGLDANETHTLMTLAEREAEDATDYYQFTSLINREFSREQKRRVIEALWRVAYADGHIDKYERHLLRKLGELLYIPHADYVAAKERARAAAQAKET
ncbi:MAG TPA: TerB family tellurite resistance protein [Acidiferrobacterales bacterium]